MNIDTHNGIAVAIYKFSERVFAPLVTLVLLLVCGAPYWAAVALTLVIDALRTPKATININNFVAKKGE